MPSAHPALGLGWLPDGRMLVVSMSDKRVLRLEPDGALVVHADLSSLVPRLCNDMTVDRFGRAYGGNFGFELGSDEKPRKTVLVRVDPDGSARVVADDLFFPNGSVITADGATLIISETWGARLTAFDIDAAGDLSHRRLWAQATPTAPRLTASASTPKAPYGSPRRPPVAAIACAKAAKCSTTSTPAAAPSPACSAANTAAPYV